MIEIMQFASESVSHCLIVALFLLAGVTAVINFKPVEINIVYGDTSYRDDDKNDEK